MSSRRNTKHIAAAVAALAIGGGAYGVVGATAGNGSPSRSGPAAGGTTGTVVTVSGSSFTLSTPAGQKVTVKASSIASVKKGVYVLVLGTVDGTSITARKVIVQPVGKSSAAAGVVPFRQGAPSTSKEVGKIPATYSQGSGTIVGGTAANKATTAALAAYPGGIVDRVVKLSNGEYEVHTIGVNWPHHVFVDRSFKVVGAD
jgi:hypothetical protein